jgi:hypothetical protein
MIDETPANSGLVGRSSKDQLTLAALGFGMAVPVLYYGIQLGAAPYFPNYSFKSHVANALGPISRAIQLFSTPV